MSLPISVASTLPPETRQQLAIEALAKSKPISHLSADQQVSHRFVYQQGHKPKLALSESFEPKETDS
jgi:hypothetical protein